MRFLPLSIRYAITRWQVRRQSYRAWEAFQVDVKRRRNAARARHAATREIDAHQQATVLAALARGRRSTTTQRSLT